MTKPIALLCIAMLTMTVCASVARAAEDWKPAKGRLMTRWAKDVSPDKVLPEYPRPQLVRKDWQNLNGLWDYAIRPKDEPQPKSWDGKILVPFAVESALSGVMKDVGPDKRLWYRRTFSVPEGWSGKRVLLHFGAVDWDTTVYLNGKQVGAHRGGYDPFSADLTDALAKGGENELVVSVWDPTDTGEQPRGKQLRTPKGIWYTPVTGIWQTVWIEPVPRAGHIASLKITPDIDRQLVDFRVVDPGDAEEIFTELESPSGKKKSSGPGTGNYTLQFPLKIEEPELWTPEDPKLYRITITVKYKTGETDKVETYFAMRKSSMAKDDKGVLRLMLNNKPVFHLGPLDQGWWPDGLYTAPTDEALKFDIEITKKLGFNMIRKHTKVEPDRWYYWADKLGILVWQDMVTGFRSDTPHQKWDPVGTFAGKENVRSAEDRAIFDTELKAMIDAFHNHPSIVMWVPFNEGWGQFDTVRVTNWVKEYDPTRLVNCASGGNDFPVGDILDLHNYPGPAAPKPDGKRAIVLGEFGGLGLPLEGHTWQGKDNWGYRKFQNAKDLGEAYHNLYVRMRRLIDEPGLAAAVYTQTTDVEGEVNGLLTYDREVVKLPEADIVAAHKLLTAPPAEVKTIVPDARTQAIEWRYTTDKPADGWEKPGFDDAAWKTGQAGFGKDGTPGATVRTKWNTPDIWMRRTIELPEGVSATGLHLTIHHDNAAEVYLNGVQATGVRRYTTAYEEQAITPEAKATLKPGKNTIAVHCKQVDGGQYIDVGLVEIVGPAAGGK